MGNKVNPVGIRLGVVKDWSSRWFVSPRDSAATILSDIRIRQYLKKKLAQASVSRIDIERPAKSAVIKIFSSRPGVIIGKSGKDVDELRAEVAQRLGVPVQIDIEEVKKPELDAQLIAENIGAQLVARISFRRAMKRAMTTAMHSGAQGIKVMVAGRLGGAEIARTEWAKEGRIPLQTFRANIDYGFSEAFATYGVLGVKVWVFKGEVVGEKSS